MGKAKPSNLSNEASTRVKEDQRLERSDQWEEEIEREQINIKQ